MRTSSHTTISSWRQCLSGLVFLAVVALVAQPVLAAGDASARVSFMRGDATVTEEGGSAPRALNRGDRLNPGDVIETGNKAVVQVIFSDKSMLYIKANSTIKLERYRFGEGGQEGADASVTEVLKGGMRSITGLVGKSNPENVRYKAGEATIGIRGTAVEVDLNGDGATVVAFDYGKGYVESYRPGFCLLTQLGRGDGLVVSDKSLKHRRVKRKADDASQVAQSLVYAEPGRTVDVAADMGKAIPLEEALFTLAMMRELPQFDRDDLSGTIEGMSRSVGPDGVMPLLITASMLYPSESPTILEAATRGQVDMVVAVEGVLCGMADASSGQKSQVVGKAVSLGITRDQAQQVYTDLSRGCS